MVMRRWTFAMYSVLLLGVGAALGGWSHQATVQAQAANRVFELRTYTAPEGKLGDLHARFRDHTMRIFEKHGMTNVVYLSPQDAPLSQNTLVYLLAHKSRDAAKASWAAFGADPEWRKVNTESNANGKILAKVETVFLDPTGYSPMK